MWCVYLSLWFEELRPTSVSGFSSRFINDRRPSPVDAVLLPKCQCFILYGNIVFLAVYYPDESIIRRFGVWHFLCLQVSGGNLSVSLSLPRHYIVTMYVPSCGDNVLQDFVFICEGVEAVGRSYLSNSNYGAIASYYYYLRHFLRRHHRLLPVEKVKANTLMAALRNSMHKFYHVYCTNPNYRGKR